MTFELWLYASFWRWKNVMELAYRDTLARRLGFARGQRARPRAGQNCAGIACGARDVRFLSAALDGRAPSR